MNDINQINSKLNNLYKQEEELYKQGKYKESSKIRLEINKLLKSNGVYL